MLLQLSLIVFIREFFVAAESISFQANIDISIVQNIKWSLKCEESRWRNFCLAKRLKPSSIWSSQFMVYNKIKHVRPNECYLREYGIRIGL